MPFSNPFRRAKKDKQTVHADGPDENNRVTSKSVHSNGNKLILERPPLLFHVQVCPIYNDFCKFCERAIFLMLSRND